MIARSPPPIRKAGRGSRVARNQLSPPSSDRYTPNPAAELYSPSAVVATVAYRRPGLLGATATLICDRFSGRPCVSLRQWSPPSEDLWSPPAVPLKTFLSSHGPDRTFHSAAYSTFGSCGSIWMQESPVSSSTYSTRVQFLPPSSDR